MDNLLNNLRSLWEQHYGKIIYLIPVLIIAITVHEFFHAFTANKLGDPTAKNQGRLTLNPLKHLDPIGTLFLIIASFGWGKPVPVAALNFKNPRRDTALVSLAGPLSNLIMAFVASFILGVLEAVYMPFNAVTKYIVEFFFYLSYINFFLAVLNLLPIYPLDGAKIFSLFLPERIYYKMINIERYFFLILIVLMFSGVLGVVIGFLSGIFEFIAQYTTRLAGNALGDLINGIFNL